jgi:hypothetical protein
MAYYSKICHNLLGRHQNKHEVKIIDVPAEIRVLLVPKASHKSSKKQITIVIIAQLEASDIDEVKNYYN